MEKRPLIKADLLIHAVKTKTHKVTIAMMNPKDIPNYDTDYIRILMGGTEIIPSDSVERGMLYVSTQQLR